MAKRTIYHSIAELTGETPLVELTNYEKAHDLPASVLAKLEYFNPSGSVKDRAALAMILNAQEKGKIKPGDTIMDFSSGNTGIALAAYANALGYRFAVVLQPGVSKERTQILKAYGAIFLEFKDIPGVPELIAKKGLQFDPFYDLLQAYADERGWYYINQGRNPANPNAHIATTGPEIWEATQGKVDYLVALVGTGGTLIGVGSYLRKQNPSIRIIGVQPAPESLKDSRYPERNTLDGVLVFDGVPEGKRIRYFDEFDFQYDEVIEVNADDAYAVGRELVKTDGIFLGQSSAAAVKVAADVARRPEAAGKNIVAICADNAFKYLSTNIYRED